MSLCGNGFTKRKERNLEKDIFFKMLNLSVHAEICKNRKYGNIPTISSLVNTICGTIINISVHYKHGRIGLALTKQQKLEGLIKTGFSPTIQSSTWLYEMIEKF